ncbi:MAG: hypothetical protein ABH835_04230 [Patescibacteria group bacterium]
MNNNQTTPPISPTPNPASPSPQSPPVVSSDNSIKLSKIYTSPLLLSFTFFIVEIVLAFIPPFSRSSGFSIFLALIVSYFYTKKTNLLLNKDFSLKTSAFYFAFSSIMGVAVILMYLPSRLQSIDQTGQTVISYASLIVQILSDLGISAIVFFALTKGGKFYLKSLNKISAK